MAWVEVQRPIPHTDFTLRYPRNWTATFLFTVLGGLHLLMAVIGLLHQRWECFLSVVFAILFGVAAAVCAIISSELTVLPDLRQLRLRTGSRRFFSEWIIPFSRVHSVRLTLLSPGIPETSTIELVCDGEVIECPPTSIPREEALCLAVTMRVRLIKVFTNEFNPAADRLDKLHSA